MIPSHRLLSSPTFTRFAEAEIVDQSVVSFMFGGSEELKWTNNQQRAQQTREGGETSCGRSVNITQRNEMTKKQSDQKNSEFIDERPKNNWQLFQ